MKAVGAHRAGMLIELVQNSPELYDRNHKHFRNNAMREMAWQNISDVLKVDCKTLHKAWNAMRNHYTQSIRNSPRRNKWRDYCWAEKLAFLRVHIKPDREYDKITRIVSDAADDALDYNDEDDYNQTQDDESLEESKNFADDKVEHLENRRDENNTSDYSVSQPAAKRKPAVQQPQTPKQQQPTTNTPAANCDGCSSVRDTFEAFFTQALARLPRHRCAKERPFDELDRFFLGMSLSVRETNITGMDLLHLKSKMLYHLFVEVTKIKNK